MSWTATFSRRLLAAGIVNCVIAGLQASAQQPVYEKEEAIPVSPAKSPGPMTLDQCLELGFQHQPALDAARASLNAAAIGARSVDRLIMPRLFMRDFRIRQQQAHLGVHIADAGVAQAEQETRYAITRTYFTMQFIDAQAKVVDEVLSSLTKSRARAKQLFEKPTPDSKITQIDLDQLDIGLATVKSKKAQIDNGREKALAAMREAMGLNYDYPLEVTSFDLSSLAYYKIQEPATDDKGQTIMKDGKVVMKDKYLPLYPLTGRKGDLIASAVASRGEIAQAQTALRVAELEVSAQYRKFGLKAETFAAGGDVHSKMVPQSIFNGEYRPGAFAPEWPTILVGRRNDRAARASALTDRSAAVVDKAQTLVSLDVEAQFLKTQEAITEALELIAIQEIARGLPKRVEKLNPNEFTSRAVIDANITAITVRTQLNDALHMNALGLAGLERATAGAFRVFPVPSPK
jgi:outer membrane efflux protein